MQQAEDFRAESQALAAVLQDLPEADLHRATLFKEWTIDHVLGHLHLFNVAAETSLQGAAAFAAFIGPIVKEMQAGKSILDASSPGLMACRAAPCLRPGRQVQSAAPTLLRRPTQKSG
ncbi:maleylpyruvate isomerase N-terminal domain-containing protein [Pseudophaeobacter arcticus]|uniref:maleylpyruvate isomerase N-terminal domain-containing protein n=1 Tax=Pseudophaeobacter arcticus TaxID=385492 RepID=UPI000424EBC5|nr:maleylpyruvate isomerase N-terminal domain-containing protein [Pseudophaeobacter arcticus]